MALFEDFKPKLKPCEIHREGHLIVVEESLSGRHYVLSSDAGTLLDAFDGTRTIKDIVTDLHSAGLPFSFKNLFSTIQQLHKAGFLVNEECPLVPVLERRGKLRTLYERARSLDVKKILIRQIQPNFKSPGAFLLLGSLWIIAGLAAAGLGRFDRIGNTFLQYNGSYAKGVLFYLAAVSILLSLKAIVQFMFLELASGKVYGISVRVSRLSAHFSVSDASIYLARGKFVPALFHVASFFTPLVITAAASLFLGDASWFGDLKTVALFLTLLELNPYFPSDFQKLLYLFQRDEIRSHLIPFLKNRALLAFLSKEASDDGIFIAYSTFAMTWSTGTLYFLSTLMEKNCANLMLAAETLGPPEREAAVLILAAIGLHWLYFVFDLVSTLAKNLYYPMSARVEAWRRQSRMTAASLNDPAAAIGILCKNPLFSDIDQATLRQVLQRGKVRSYPANTKLIVQGSKNATLFAIIEGRVRVTRRAASSAMQDIAVLGPSGVFGEISAIGKQETTADVVTLGRTLCLELTPDVLKDLNVSRMMERILVGHFMSCSPTFKNLPKEVISLVMARGKLNRVAAGTVIFEEGTMGNSLFLLVRGSVDVAQGGQKIRALAQGDFFGEIAVISKVPRTATVRASEDCVLLQLDSGAFWEILAENTQFSLFIESVAEMRERESGNLKAAA